MASARLTVVDEDAVGLAADLSLTDSQRTVTRKVGNAPSPAQAVIGNLLTSASGTLEVACELTRLSGNTAMAEEMEQVRLYLARLASRADRLLEMRIDSSSLSQSLDPDKDLATALAGEMSPALKFYFEQRVQACLPHLGRSESRVLLCLLQNSGQFVSRSVLQVVVESKTPMTNIIKVYVSRLRKALAELGLDDAIETGTAGYRLREDRAANLIEALSAS
jgi:hypothetical protein